MKGTLREARTVIDLADEVITELLSVLDGIEPRASFNDLTRENARLVQSKLRAWLQAAP